MSFRPAERLNSVSDERAVPAEVAPWALGPALSRADGPALCALLADRLRSSSGTAGATGLRPYTVDVSGVAGPDLGTVETLARLQLTARRFGYHLRFLGADPLLRDLVELAGLTPVLPMSYFGDGDIAAIA